MFIKDGKVGSNHSDQSQVCQLHCFVTTKPNAPHMRGTPPQTDAGSPRHHRQQSGPRGATSPARGKLRTRIVWSPREVRRFRIDRLRLHGRYGRCGSERDHQSLLACRIEPGHASARPHPTVPAKRRRTASATRQHARTLLLHAALGESIRDLNDQQSLELGEPSTAPQRVQRG